MSIYMYLIYMCMYHCYNVLCFLSLQAGVQAQPEKGMRTQHIQNKFNTASKTITVPVSQCHTWLGVPSDRVYMYHSVAKERPWVGHLTSLPERGVGAHSCVSAFNHERGPMYAYSNSPPLNSLKYRTNNNVQQSCRPWMLKF